MSRVEIEVVDLKRVDSATLKILRRRSFGDGGWMTGCMDQILRGYALSTVYVHPEGVQVERVDISYDQAHALIARDETGEILGWALVRHPKKRTRVKYRAWDWDERTYIDKWAYGGRRSDFMVYVASKHRKKRVARQLLLVAFNNFGRVDAYPHDAKSERFYKKNARFVTAYNTNDFSTAQYKTREVY